jgi:ornithine--oxo-acid transaminase
MGQRLFAELATLASAAIGAVRGRGLLIGIEVQRAAGSARQLAERLAARGVLSKDTHEQVLRLAPPLNITEAELDWLIEQLRAEFTRG